MTKGNVTNMFIINLAISDTLVLFVSAPFKVRTHCVNIIYQKFDSTLTKSMLKTKKCLKLGILKIFLLDMHFYMKISTKLKKKMLSK